MKSFFAAVIVLAFAATGCATTSTQTTSTHSKTASQDDLEHAPRVERSHAH